MGRRGSDHVKAQRGGKERDLFICQACGSSDKPEGHHIIEHQYGGAAKVDNIITLCQDCHRKVHKGKIDLVLF